MTTTSIPYDLLRSGFPYYMTLGQRRVTTAPVDIGFGKENIYVLTKGGLGTQIRVLNWEDENLGVRGGTDLFQWPAGLLVDDEENLYVSDEAKDCLVIMNKDGEHIQNWGESGSDEGHLIRPCSLAVDLEGYIFISDTMNHRIQKFTRDGKFLQSIGEMGTGDGQFDMPWGISVDQLGNLYVADWRNDRVQKFDESGNFVFSLGSSGSEKGQFKRPTAVTVDNHGDIYVSDAENDRVQLFNKDLKYIQSFHGNATLSPSGQQYILANAVTLRLRSMADFEKTQRLDAPMMVIVDDEFRLFILDYGNHRIQIYKKDAVELSKEQIAPEMRNPILFTT